MTKKWVMVVTIENAYRMGNKPVKGRLTQKPKMRTLSPTAAAGPLGSIVCTYTGLEPRMTNPYPTGSLTT